MISFRMTFVEAIFDGFGSTENIDATKYAKVHFFILPINVCFMHSKKWFSKICFYFTKLSTDFVHLPGWLMSGIKSVSTECCVDSIWSVEFGDGTGVDGGDR